MKKISVLIALLIFLFACKKSAQSEESVNTDITGKWKLSDYYVSPGTGVDLNAIPWVAADPSNKVFIEFKPDGVFINSQDLSLMPDHYSVTDSTVTIIRQGHSVVLGYKLDGHYLSIYGNFSFEAMCIEFCGTRYISSR